MRFSVFIWAKDTSLVFFRECLATLSNQTFSDFEVFLMDENRDERALKMSVEFFPRDSRMIYHRMKNHKGLGYCFNAALHKAKGDYILFLGQHDRISDNTLEVLDKSINDEFFPPDFVYFDHDELIGADRMNPQFKCGINVELLRHWNYIGDFFVVRKETFRNIGLFNQNIKYAVMYEYLLRGVEKKRVFLHIPRLLYHQRIISTDVSNNAEIINAQRTVYREHMVVCSAHLRRMGITATLKPHRSMQYWFVMYNESFKRYRSRFYVIREDGVRVSHREKSMNRMYGILAQDSVGIVGIRFDRNALEIENAGYIFDSEGMAYPACHGHRSHGISYRQRNILTTDVSMVDPAFFLIDAEVFKRIGGLNRRLTGRAQMLDLCLKVRRVHRRVVCDTMTTARKKRRENLSSEESNTLLIERWGEILKKGDPYYNRNLPIGLENYFLY